jgi:transposase
LQLELLAEQEPGATREEVEAEARRQPLPPPRERKPHPGRKPLPENLPRIEQVIACSEPNCKSCGAETSLIGYDESEVLDHEPARWFVRVTKREKRACGKCSSIAMPELAPRIVEKGLASDNVVIHTVIAKYCTCRCIGSKPFWNAKRGWRSAAPHWMAGWWVGELLTPMVSAMRQDLLRQT